MSLDQIATAKIKASLLAKGINFDLDLFKQIEKPFYDNQFVYGKTSENITPEHKFPQILGLGNKVITALLRRENSPWSLRIEEGEVQLYNSNNHIMTVELSEENIAEATRLFQNTPWRDIRLISVTMGTCKTDKETREKVIKPIRWMYDALDPKIPIHILAHPPNDYDLIGEFKDAGVTSIAFNLEVYNPQRFEEICPGKAQLYGYEKWVEALMQAKNVFGDYNTFCGLIWGMESQESTIAGHQYFLEEKIGIASNVFHSY